MHVTLNSLFDRGIEVYYATDVLKQLRYKHQMRCPNYIVILEFKNVKKQNVLQVHPGA